MKEAVEKLKPPYGIRSEIINEEDWGLRKLAYPSKRKQRLLPLSRVQSDPSVIEKLEINFRALNVIRFLTIKQDKFALECPKKEK